MMLVGVHLRTGPELAEQHRLGEEDKKLGMESVHMAESETKCTAPGLNTLEPECVTADSRVSDLHHIGASLMRTETILTTAKALDHIKAESSDFAPLANATHLHPDQVKTETNDENSIQAEYVSFLPGIGCVDAKFGEVKLESREILVTDLLNTPLNGADVDEKSQRKPRLCAGGLNSQEYHLSHHQRIHSGEKLHKCDQCQKCFVRRSHLKSHLRIHSGEKPYKCTQCEKSFSFKNNLLSHVQIHTGEKPYKCNNCEKNFSRRSNLRSHARMHTGEKPYKCHQCERRFSRRFLLKSHLKMHAGEKPFKCKLCEKNFSWKSHLISHQRIHTKPYKCNCCEKNFSSQSNLRSHARIHTGEKPYKCNRCEKSFSCKSNLCSHARIHTGEKPYKCDQCEKSFSDNSNFHRHKKIHGGEKSYS